MEKNFKIEFMPQVDTGLFSFESEYETIIQAVAVLNAIANYTLFLHECSLMPDYSNVGMLFKRDGSNWIEIGDDGIEI